MLKLFGILLSTDIVVSVESLFTGMTMSIDDKTSNGLSLSVNSFWTEEFSSYVCAPYIPAGESWRNSKEFP